MQLYGTNWANNFSKQVGTGKKYRQSEADAFYALSKKTGISAVQLARDAEKGISHAAPAPPPPPVPKAAPLPQPKPPAPVVPFALTKPPPPAAAPISPGPITIPIFYKPAAATSPQQVPEAPPPGPLPPVPTMPAQPAPVQVSVQAPAAFDFKKSAPMLAAAAVVGFFMLTMNKPKGGKRRG